MTNLHDDLPLFQWRVRRSRHPLPAIVRRIARRAGISHLHALAFIEANGIGSGDGR